ncbi:MAG: prepilin-type N-terminal cleavage/methylation domain-containing protein [Sandaracinus sp.]
MARHSTSPRPRPRRRAGYTLIELMVVVAIIGILAAIAIPAFNAYVMRSRTLEAYDFLGEIHLRQESYRAEFGQYANIPTWNPAAIPPHGQASPWVSTGAWSQLGAVADSNVRFQYQVLAGAPGVAAPVPDINNDFWFVSQAQADLDGDGVTMAIEGYSGSSHYYVSRGIGGAYLASGWE